MFWVMTTMSSRVTRTPATDVSTDCRTCAVPPTVSQAKFRRLVSKAAA
jgi:hypothetical protein